MSNDSPKPKHNWGCLVILALDILFWVWLIVTIKRFL